MVIVDGCCDDGAFMALTWVWGWGWGPVLRYGFLLLILPVAILGIASPMTMLHTWRSSRRDETGANDIPMIYDRTMAR